MYGEKKGRVTDRLFSCLFLSIAIGMSAMASESGVGEQIFNVVSEAGIFAAQKKEHETAQTFDLGKPRIDNTREWTLLIYMDGDNNLEKAALNDIEEMERGIEGPMEAIVLIDRAKGYDRSEGDWSDTRIYRIRRDTKKGIHSELLATPGELNLGDPAVLKRFIVSGAKTFPARHYGVILWDHGGGWAAHVNDADAPGSLNGEDYLTLPELSRALGESLKEIKRASFDIVGFDMCLMGQIETAVELKGLARVVVASEATEPGNGWPYDEILPEFTKGTQGVRRIAASIVEHYGAYYRKTDQSIYTLTAMDLERLDLLQSALDRLSEKIEGTLSGDWATLARSIFFSEAYMPRDRVQRGKQALASVDLMDTLKRIRLNSRSFHAMKAYEKVVDAMDRFILATTSSSARRLSNGLAIYAPVSDKVFNRRYEATRFSAGSAWIKMLKKLYKYQNKNQKPARIGGMRLVDFSGNSIRNTPYAMPLGTQGVICTVEGKDILWLRASFGEKSSDKKETKIYLNSVVIDANWTKRKNKTTAAELDYLVPEYQDGINRHTILYQGYRLKITNGRKEAYATVNIPLDSGMISVPVLYRHPKAGLLKGVVYFDKQWLESRGLVVEIPQKDGTIFYQQIRPDPQADVTLLFETVSDTGKRDYIRSETMKWGENLMMFIAMDRPGTYELTLTAETIGASPTVAKFTFPVKANPVIQNVMKAGSGYEMKDLLGSWIAIDPDEFFAKNNLKILDSGLTYTLHPKNKNILVQESFKGSNPVVKQYGIGWFQKGDIPVVSMIPLNEQGEIDVSAKREDFLTLLIPSPNGKRLMFRVDLNTHIISLYIQKDSKSTPGPLAPPSSSQTSPGTSSGILTPPNETGIIRTLEGSWHSENGITFLFAGERYRLSERGKLLDSGNYRIRNGVLTLYNRLQGGPIEFRFAIREGVLNLQSADGTRYSFRRTDSSQAATDSAPASGSSLSRLQGRYCSYSGSGGAYGSSYSHSNWAYFDGRGNFTYGSSSYSGGGAGSYYTNQGGNGRGTYRIRGKEILLLFPDGSGGRAYVYRQRSDGMITEVKYEGLLYAPALCE